MTEVAIDLSQYKISRTLDEDINTQSEFPSSAKSKSLTVQFLVVLLNYDFIFAETWNLLVCVVLTVILFK